MSPNFIGVTFQQLQKYEAGKNRVSTAGLVQLAGVLSVEASTLLRSSRRS